MFSSYSPAVPILPGLRTKGTLSKQNKHQQTNKQMINKPTPPSLPTPVSYRLYWPPALYVAVHGLEFLTLLLPLAQCCGYRQVLWFSVSEVSGMDPRLLYTLPAELYLSLLPTAPPKMGSCPIFSVWPRLALNLPYRTGLRL